MLSVPGTCWQRCRALSAANKSLWERSPELNATQQRMWKIRSLASSRVLIYTSRLHLRTAGGTANYSTSVHQRMLTASAALLTKDWKCAAAMAHLRIEGGAGGLEHHRRSPVRGQVRGRLSVTAPATRAARAEAGAARRARGAERGQSGAGGRLARDLTVTGTLPLPRSAPRGRHCACAAPPAPIPSAGDAAARGDGAVTGGNGGDGAGPRLAPPLRAEGKRQRGRSHRPAPSGRHLSPSPRSRCLPRGAEAPSSPLRPAAPHRWL